MWQETGDILENGNTDEDIYYRSIIGGELTDYVLLTNNYNDNFYGGDSAKPAIAINANDVGYVAWRDKTNVFGWGTDEDIFLHTLSNGQIRESPDTIYQKFLGSNFDSSSGPDMQLLDSGELLLTWAEKNAEGNSDIAYIRLEDDGSMPPWLNPPNAMSIQIATVTGATSYSPAVAVSSSGTIHLAWHDDATLDPITDTENADGTDTDIFYLAITP